MVEIFSQHRAELSALKREVALSRLALSQVGGWGGAEATLHHQAGLHPADLASEAEEGGGEARSGVESTTSEVSWEAVEEGETRPTLWVPDHAASQVVLSPPSSPPQCMGCHTQFWFGRRKHHCRYPSSPVLAIPTLRSCGLLFCSECSEQALPLPTEQLYTPGRRGVV